VAKTLMAAPFAGGVSGNHLKCAASKPPTGGADVQCAHGSDRILTTIAVGIGDHDGAFGCSYAKER
jgi:hypothetical protein